MDFSGFRNIAQMLMTDSFDVLRETEGGVDEWGTPKPKSWETIYSNKKCRVSQMNQNFDNPNAESVDSIPLLYKLKVFGPQDVIIKKGDLITLKRTVGNKVTTYEKKRASDYMQYDNHIEFYIGINEEA